MISWPPAVSTFLTSGFPKSPSFWASNPDGAPTLMIAMLLMESGMRNLKVGKIILGDHAFVILYIFENGNDTDLNPYPTP